MPIQTQLKSVYSASIRLLLMAIALMSVVACQAAQPIAISSPRPEVLPSPSLTLPVTPTLTGTPRVTMTETFSPTAAFKIVPESVHIVRTHPYTWANVIDRLQPGRSYTVLGRFIEWYLVALDDGKSGWVYQSSDYNQRFHATQVPEVTVTWLEPPVATPHCTPASIPNKWQALKQAQAALETFITLLNAEDYTGAAQWYGGDYLVLQDQHWNIDPLDHAGLFHNACQITGYRCYKLKRIVSAQIAGPGHFTFEVEFQNPDGSLWVMGPCCGGDATRFPPKSRFTYDVVLDCQGRYWVLDLPIYIP